MKDYTGTTMRMAGNIAAGLVTHAIWAEKLRHNPDATIPEIATVSCRLAQAIAREASQHETALD